MIIISGHEAGRSPAKNWLGFPKVPWADMSHAVGVAGNLKKFPRVFDQVFGKCQSVPTEKQKAALGSAAGKKEIFLSRVT
jgi:hypothetical protein